jgi:hypothetical protein
MGSILSTIIEIPGGFFGFISNYETAKFTLLNTSKEYQIRRYSPSIIAQYTTSVTTGRKAETESFRAIAG